MFKKALYLIYDRNEPELSKRLFCVAVFVAIIVSIVGTIVNVKLNMHWVLEVMISMGALMLSGVFVLARFYKKYYKWEFVFIVLVLLSGAWLYNEGPNGSTNYLYIFALVLFISITNRNQHLWVSLIVIANLILLYLISFYKPELVIPYLSEGVRQSDLILTFSYTIVLVALVFSVFRIGFEDEKEKVNIQKDLIEEQHLKIKQSISYSKGMQKAILQEEESLSAFFKSHFVLWKPRDEIGGDFYQVVRHPVYQHIYYVAVADCTGHGVPGAMLTMLGISFLHDIILQNSQIQANEVLNMMRTKVKEALSQKTDSIHSFDGMDMLICQVNTKTRHLEYAGANRSLYLIRDGELLEYKPDRMPIAAYVDDHVSFAKQDIKLKENDLLILTTDGFADQYGGPKQKKFYVSKFKKLLLKISDKPLVEQKDQLIRELDDWQKDEEQTDDILVFGFVPF